MFEQISGKFHGVFKRLRGQPRLSERHVDEALREIRMALLEADVHFSVTKDFCARVREKSVGSEVLESLSSAQHVIKVVRDELVVLLGGAERRLELQDPLPSVIVVAGLQGSGKTTSCAKLAKYLRDELQKHPVVVSVDVHRPAAIEQLSALATGVSIPVIEPDSMEPISRAKQALAKARDAGFDVLIVDTAGRVHVDDSLMKELSDIAAATSPSEILFVADAMTGQDAVRSAAAFAESVPISGHILTKLDGDARGGAALSITATTGRPVKFVGLGEKTDAFEPFRPDRMASRILGMGDVLSLIEKAEKVVELDVAENLKKKLRREELTLEDFRSQLRQMKRMGSLSDIMSLLPGQMGSQGPAEIDDGEFKRFEAILDSMTRFERENPQVVNGSRRRRIASGSGVNVSDVNRLLRRFGEAKKMVKKLARLQSSGKGGARKLARMLGGMGQR